MAGPRTPLISGNWKMHHDHLAAIDVVQRLIYRLDQSDLPPAEVCVHPPFTDLRSVQVVLENDETALKLGAQHCHWEDSGAFTGEVSPTMLARLRVRYVLAGHSERREYFGETDELVNRRVHAIINRQMVPIVCVGETEPERDAGLTEQRLVAQVAAGLDGLSAEQVGGLVVAYEPVWAIGTGRSATPADAQAGAATIRGLVRDRWGDAASLTVRIQYGGSVTTVNAAELLAQPDVDGALVGGASLDADSFATIVAAAPS